MAVKKEPAKELAPEKVDNMGLLQEDIISLARDICKGIKDGSCRDYYKSIEAVISLYGAIKK